MRVLPLAVCAVCLVGFTLTGWGCAGYHRKPLTHAAVDQALQVAPDQGAGGAGGTGSKASQGAGSNPLTAVLDPSQPLSPKEAQVIAVLINPSLRAERDRAGLSQAQIIEAGLLPNPQLSYSMDFPVGASTTGEANAFGIGVDWNVTALITHGARTKAAKAHAGQVNLEVAWQEWQIAEAAEAAAYRVIALRDQVMQWRRIDRELRKNLTLVRRAVKQHNRTASELAAAEASSRQVHDSRLAAEADLAQQQLALNRALGVPPQTRVQVQTDVSLPDRINLPPREKLFGAIDDRLDLQALRRGYASQEQTVRAAVLGQFPQISLGFASTRDTGNFYTIGPSVSISLPIFDRNQGRIAIARATREQLFDQYVQRVFTARAEVAKALNGIQTLTRRITAAHAAVESLNRLVDTYRRAVDQANADVLSFYQARKGLAQKQITVIQLKQQLLDHRVGLELATGLDLDPGTTHAGEGHANQLSPFNGLWPFSSKGLSQARDAGALNKPRLAQSKESAQ